MKLPTELAYREGLFADLVQQCLVSRENRKAQYDTLRSYYLFGCGPNNQPAVYNKIRPSIDTLSSFLFAEDTARFAIQLGAGANKNEGKKIPALMTRLNDKTHDSNLDAVFSDAVLWSLVYNSMFIKLLQRGPETIPFLIEPHNFGVLYEHIPMLDRQEAFTHTYLTNRYQLERDLANHPRRVEILSRATARPNERGMLPAGVQRIIMNSEYPLSGGTMTGNVNDVLAGTQLYIPETNQDLIQMHELWVWNDDAEGGRYNPLLDKRGGWQIVTMTDPDICIYDRPAAPDMFLMGEHPYTHVCPNRAPDYFFGYSEVFPLIQLQDQREHHMRQVRMLVDRNVTSPKILQGTWGAVEEKDRALASLGALISSQDPTAKVQEFKPQLPPDMWATIREIDGMFDESISLNNLSKGHGDTGVRSKGQTDSLLRVGSSRPKKRALVVEDSLERIATLYMKLDQAHNPDELHMDDGKPFIAEQFTKDFMVRVDAHSSSPIFMEDQKKMAAELFQMGIIDGEAVLDMLQPQNVQQLKERYKEMQKKREMQAQQEKVMQAAQGSGKVARIGAG